MRDEEDVTGLEDEDRGERERLCGVWVARLGVGRGAVLVGRRAARDGRVVRPAVAELAAHELAEEVRMVVEVAGGRDVGGPEPEIGDGLLVGSKARARASPLGEARVGRERRVAREPRHLLEQPVLRKVPASPPFQKSTFHLNSNVEFCKKPNGWRLVSGVETISRERARTRRVRGPSVAL